jgi:hypothetical protein
MNLSRLCFCAIPHPTISLQAERCMKESVMKWNAKMSLALATVAALFGWPVVFTAETHVGFLRFQAGKEFINPSDLVTHLGESGTQGLAR